MWHASCSYPKQANCAYISNDYTFINYLIMRMNDMTNLAINDLEHSLELDRKAMSAIRGAWGLGSVFGKVVKVATGVHGAVAGGVIGGVVGGVGGFLTGRTSIYDGARYGGRLGWRLFY